MSRSDPTFHFLKRVEAAAKTLHLCRKAKDKTQYKHLKRQAAILRVLIDKHHLCDVEDCHRLVEGLEKRVAMLYVELSMKGELA